MELLLSEELASETLFEALAFIDAYELSSSSDDQDLTSMSSSSPCVSSPEPEAAATKRRSSPPSGSARPRKRQSAKSELERLRQDVQTLEKTLAGLRGGRTALPQEQPDAASAAAIAAKKELESMWMDFAVRQHRRRQQSEATNHQLKRAVAKQLKIAKFLEAQLERRTMAEDLEASYDLCLSDFRQVQTNSRDDELLFANLSLHSHQLYATMDSHIKDAGLQIDLMALHTSRKQDPLQGAVLQTVASYPVPFSVQQTDATVWEGLFKGHPKGKPVVGHVQNRTFMEDGLKKNFLTTFQHGQHTYDLHSRTVLRRYMESNKIVYAWTSVTVLGRLGLRFLAQAMMVIEPSPTLPLNATVLKNFHRIHGDQIDPAKLACPLTGPLIDTVMKTLSGNTATMWSWFESYLLGGTGDDDDDSAKPLCARH